MRLMTAVLAGLLASTACAPSPALIAPVETRAPITFSQLLAGPRTAADERIAYGPDALQFGELWLPRRQGRHPVIVLIHGGCWRADLPGLELMDYMAADLRDRGYAVWNLEYRRIGHPGGGYPGTFRDIAAGVDHLRTIAAPHSLDLRRVALAGHSAGGHLALWAAARDRLPAESPLRTARPLPIRGVVSLAGITDLDAYIFTMLRHAVSRRRRQRDVDRRAIDTVARQRAEAGRFTTQPTELPDDALTAAVAGLPPAQREVLALKIDGGLTFAEIAAVIGTSINTAASRYRYAIEKLRTTITVSEAVR